MIKKIINIILLLLVWNIIIYKVDFKPNYYEAEGTLTIYPRIGPIKTFGVNWRSRGFKDKYGWGYFHCNGLTCPDETNQRSIINYD